MKPAAANSAAGTVTADCEQDDGGEPREGARFRRAFSVERFMAYSGAKPPTVFPAPP